MLDSTQDELAPSVDIKGSFQGNQNTKSLSSGDYFQALHENIKGILYLISVSSVFAFPSFLFYVEVYSSSRALYFTSCLCLFSPPFFLSHL